RSLVFRGRSSTGRALRSQRRGWRFDPARLHHRPTRAWIPANGTGAEAVGTAPAPIARDSSLREVLGQIRVRRRTARASTPPATSTAVAGSGTDAASDLSSTMYGLAVRY